MSTKRHLLALVTDAATCNLPRGRAHRPGRLARVDRGIFDYVSRITTQCSSSGGAATAGFVLGLVCAGVIAGVGFWLFRGSGVRIDTSRPAVVHYIQQLQRLETVVYGMDKIVSGGQEALVYRSCWPETGSCSSCTAR